MSTKRIDVLDAMEEAAYALNDRATVAHRNNLLDARDAVAELMEQLDTYLKGHQEDIDSDYHWIRRERLQDILINMKE